LEGWSIDADHETEKLALVSPALRRATTGAPGAGGGIVSVCVTALNVAVTVAAALIVTVQVPVPLHPPPLHPANVDPDAAAAVSTTEVPVL
jgi:hypothetical protein